VTPWTVESDEDGNIDYDKLVNEFGSQRITREQIEMIENKTSIPLHPLPKKRTLLLSQRFELHFG